MKKISLIIILLTSVLSFLAANDVSEPIAIVLEIEGEALISRKNSQFNNFAVIGTEVFNGDTLSTEDSSVLTLLFSDDTTTTFKGKNEIKFDTIEEVTGIKKFLKGFWNSIRSKFIDNEKSVLDSNLVGSIRATGEDEINLSNRKLNKDEESRLLSELGYIHENINNEYSSLLFRAIKFEEYEQYLKSESLLLNAIEVNKENEQAYNSLISIYAIHNSLEKIEEIKQLKNNNSW